MIIFSDPIAISAIALIVILDVVSALLKRRIGHVMSVITAVLHLPLAIWLLYVKAPLSELVAVFLFSTLVTLFCALIVAKAQRRTEGKNEEKEGEV